MANGKLIFQQTFRDEKQLKQHQKTSKNKEYRQLLDKKQTAFTTKRSEKYLVSKESKSCAGKLLKLHHHKVSKRRKKKQLHKRGDCSSSL